MTDLEKALALIAAFTTILSAVGGVPGILALFSRRQAARRTDAETDKIQAEATTTLVAGSSQLIDQLQEELRRVRDEIGALKIRVSDLEKDKIALQETVKVALNRINELEAEKSQLLVRMADLEQRNVELAARVAQLEAENAELRADNLVLVQELAERIGQPLVNKGLTEEQEQSDAEVL